MLTKRQRIVFAKVCKADLMGERYRAEDSGERVTLASLYYRRLLVRWAWRGKEGERDAAHEYALEPIVREALRKEWGIAAHPWIVVGAKLRTARGVLGPGQLPQTYTLIRIGPTESLVQGPKGIEPVQTSGIAVVLEPLESI